MPLLDEYDFKRLPPDLVEFLGDLTTYWNAGRFPVYYDGSPPTSSTLSDGPSIRIAKDGSTWYIYVYTDSTDGWKKVALGAL